MLCKNRITLIGFLRQHAETRYTSNGSSFTRFPVATSVSLKVKETGEYNTRTEWHRVVSWNKLGQWAANLQKSAYVEGEGELRYREYTLAESDLNVRVAKIYASSILVLDRSDRQRASQAVDSDCGGAHRLTQSRRGIGAESMPGFLPRSFSMLMPQSIARRKTSGIGQL